MKRRMLDFLICPYDRFGPFELISDKLVCRQCKREYPIISGIPSIMPDALNNEAKAKEIKKRDELATTYQAHFTDYMNRIEAKVIFNRLRPDLGDLIIDIGSGTGRLAIDYKDKCKSFLAVDFSLESLKVLKEKLVACGMHNFDILHADVTFLPVRDKFFDKALSSQVFEHLPGEAARQQGLSNVSRVLKDSGEFVLTVYNYNLYKRTNIFGVDTTGNKKEGFHSQDQIYYYNFTRNDLKKFLNVLFLVKDIMGFFSVPRQITWKFKGKIGKCLGDIIMCLDLALSKMRISDVLGLLLVAKCKKC